ncbi:RNA 2',3'-cyclic phosphodiesterase [Mameliella alba]|uniref:RNA 2',3'-cyclic phosphodiesterase n=1 Tax=Mameliella alba TaxID=561184 RepID=A0A0B3S774_9RHOB|nr:RNA 2',3'-cyclic phosphodiesterase [Mameliella alba]KHQ52521.1 2',5' RNA ligase [Mameliella alba]
MRLFIALSLPEEARDALDDLQSRFPIGRPTPYENLHLTLAFLGEQDEETTEAVHDALQTLRAPALDLTLTGASIFGGRHGQAVALEADGNAPLNELRDRVLARLRSVGVAPERRRFRPHVTLARLRGQADASPLLAVLASASIGPFACNSFGLFASTLHQDGALHEELARYPLSPPR